MLLTFSALSLVKFFSDSSLIHFAYFEHLYFRNFCSALIVEQFGLFGCFLFCFVFSIESCIKLKLWRKATSPLWMEDKRLITAATFFDVHFKEQWERPGATEDLIMD